MVLATVPQPAAGPHHKKRHGHHHKVASKHYVKTYWPYLPMLLVVILGFVINTMWNSGQGVLSYATSMNVSALLQETNIQRSQHGKTALALNGLLNQAAQQKANDMAARNYWSHTSPEGTQPWQVISSVGYVYTTAGENLAYGFATSADTVTGWMNSAGHRANVLSTDFREVGFGIANSENYQGDGEQTIVVAMYATPKALAAAPAPAKTTPPKKAAPAPQPSAPAQQTPAPEPTPAPAAQPEQPIVAQTNQDTVVAPNSQELTQKEIARVDVLTAGNAEWATLAAVVLVTVGALTFLYRHAKMWRRFLTKGEHFVIRHPVFDTLIVAVVVAGILLTQTTGFIH